MRAGDCGAAPRPLEISCACKPPSGRATGQRRELARDGARAASGAQRHPRGARTRLRSPAPQRSRCVAGGWGDGPGDPVFSVCCRGGEAGHPEKGGRVGVSRRPRCLGPRRWHPCDDRATHRAGPDVGKMAKRKHQITSLYQYAKLQELDQLEKARCYPACSGGRRAGCSGERVSRLQRQAVLQLPPASPGLWPWMHGPNALEGRGPRICQASEHPSIGPPRSRGVAMRVTQMLAPCHPTWPSPTTPLRTTAERRRLAKQGGDQAQVRLGLGGSIRAAQGRRGRSLHGACGMPSKCRCKRRRPNLAATAFLFRVVTREAGASW